MKSHNIKDILEERRMEVSENSWDQLANQLSVHDKKKKRRNVYPYAACFAVLVGLIAFIVSKSIGESQSQVIVDTETIKTQKGVEAPKPILLKEEIDDKVFKSAIVATETPNTSEIKVKKETDKKKQVTQKERKELNVAFQKEIQETIKVDTLSVMSTKKTSVVLAENIKEVKLDKELKASIAALSVTEKVTITNEEIDKLLKEAQESLSKLKVKNKEADITKYATADELLNEVEYELDMSFKQKVFELIKHKVSKTRTAVVDP
ncbi:hypothetical protein [uncultured Kordia sp.]|uniref:hypothetical protein n=1 Tax=uncultured Kordia sp. TaxID=507699 RepID=UPI002618842F|nr:hypothetical protein [uncultured Kordia sp.]